MELSLNVNSILAPFAAMAVLAAAPSVSALIWRSRANQAQHRNGNRTSRLSSFVAGLLITLGDQKAVLFYLGFLPAFLDLSVFTTSDIVLVVAVTVVAVGGVKLAYAYAAEQAGHVFGGKLGVAMNVLTAMVMLVARCGF
jgi:threonine/homoserine/homoserine lactone efflux protein